MQIKLPQVAAKLRPLTQQPLPLPLPLSLRSSPGIRLPLTPLDEAFHTSLEEALREAMCLENSPASAK